MSVLRAADMDFIFYRRPVAEIFIDGWPGHARCAFPLASGALLLVLPGRAP